MSLKVKTMEHGRLRLLASSVELRSKLRCLALLAIASSVLLIQYNLVEMMCLAEVDLDALAEAAREAASKKLPSGMTAS